VAAKTSVLENMMERLAKLEAKLKEKGKVKVKQADLDAEQE
jgi:hypothetical protein